MGTAEGTNIDGSELVLETFNSVFKKAGTFNCASRDPEVVQKMLRGWLFKILQNKYRTALRKNSKETKIRVYLEDDEDIGDKYSAPEIVETTEPSPRSELVVRAKEILESLSDRDRAILCLSLEYRNPDNGHFEIPEDELESLANNLGVLPTTIKTLRHRILKRIQGVLS